MVLYVGCARRGACRGVVSATRADSPRGRFRPIQAPGRVGYMGRVRGLPPPLGPISAHPGGRVPPPVRRFRPFQQGGSPPP